MCGSFRWPIFLVVRLGNSSGGTMVSLVGSQMDYRGAAGSEKRVDAAERPW